MRQPEVLDWLANDEGNLRPEAAEALEADPELGDVVRPDPPGEVQSAGRWVLRGLIIVGALWIVVSLFEWVLLVAFVAGLCVRFSRWMGEQQPVGAGGRDRHGRAAVRIQSDEVPEHGGGREVPHDPDPVLGFQEGRR